MYVNSKQFNPPLLGQNSQSLLGVISSFELRKVIIANSKPHRLLDSSTFNYDGTTFCSPIVNFDETTNILLLNFQITIKFL